MPNALTRRLEEFTQLTDADRAELTRFAGQSVRTIPPRRDLISEGTAPAFLYLVLDGWGSRYRTLENGRTQIVDFVVPGDLLRSKSLHPRPNGSFDRCHHPIASGGNWP